MKTIKYFLGLMALSFCLAVSGQTPGPFTAPNINITGGVITHLNTPLSYANGGTGSTGPQAADHRIFVSTGGNDANDGLSAFNPKLTIQAAVTAVASNGGIVEVGSGTYVLTSTIHMSAKVKVNCSPGATITQGAAANLLQFFDFNSNAATFSTVNGCTIDGNRAANTDSANDIMMYIGNANYVTLTNNFFLNGNGSAVDVAAGIHPTVSNNRFDNFYVGAYYAVTGFTSDPTYGQINNNTITGFIGQHAITVNNSDYNTITGNTIVARLITGMTVNTSGTTVTSTGGPNFSNLIPGEFIILNGGNEYLITSVTDSTHLQINVSAGSNTGVPCASGPGDLISILSASNNTVAHNTITGGVGGGVVISNFVGGESTQKNNVIGNFFHGQGEGCIEIESLNTFGTQVFDNSIIGNNISDCGVGGTAVASNTQYGIALIDFNPNTLLNTFIDGNYIRDDQGASHTTRNWLGLTSIAVGQVFVGHNGNVGMTNPGIAGGIVSVTLGSGWGNAATVTATSMGDSFYMTVTSSGTGQAASPSVTVNTAATTADNPPVMACQFTGGTGTIQQVFGQTPVVNTSASLVLFFFNGTPTGGNTYIFLCRG